MRTEINNLSEIGIVDDVDDHEIPVNAFSAGQNVRFKDGRVIKFKGHAQVFTAPPITPYWMIPFNDQTTYYWLLAGASKVYVTDMAGNYTNITRQNGGSDEDYSADLDLLWNGGVLNGQIPILNNGVDYPQQWSPAQTSTKLANLKYDASQTWADKNYLAKVVRVFKNYIIAMGITKAGTLYPNVIKWSSSAAAGSVPDTWDETDPAYDSREAVITENGGALIDGLPLGNNFIVYAEDAAHLMQYIGGTYVFRFARIFGDGLMSKQAVKAFKNLHLVLALNDLIAHDGNNPVSILDKRRRKWLFNNIDSTNYHRTFIVPNYRESEMWICFPLQGSTLPDMALVWNYLDNSFGVRELPGCPYIAHGVVDAQQSQIIDDQTSIIDLDNSVIDAKNYNLAIFYPLMAYGQAFYQADDTEQFAGSNMTSYIERTGLDFGEPDRVKRITRIIPRMTGTGSVTISLGSQKYPGDSVSWTDYTFTPGTDWKIDVRKSGKLIGYRIKSTGNIAWDLSSIVFEYQYGGR